MKVVALVENQTKSDLKAKHGLSLYIETEKHKILFDVGPDGTLFENSHKCGIDLSSVDTVILSHGHKDHGGALRQFLQFNQSAKVYVQERAFDKHYSQFCLLKVEIGIDASLAEHPQIVIVNGDYRIDDELELFMVNDSSKCYSNANDVLFTEYGRDDFQHEQNLIIHGEKNVLIMGCGHKGIVNILEKARMYQPSICIGGYHLFNPTTKKTVAKSLLDEIRKELERYEMTYYTCHCTGEKAYRYLAEKMKNMHYLSCGETIEI